MNNIEATTDNTAITSTEAAALAEAVAQRDPNTVTLDTPIKRGNGFITEVTLRKPSAGELRGVSLAELLQMKVDALQTVLPRITNPILHKQDMATLDPADLVNMGTVVVGFLLTKETKRDFVTE
ncbi:MAG: phage tail assembly protein [Acidovorax sp.]|nr:phage tail assembly protein [Acidovorax sp.]